METRDNGRSDEGGEQEEDDVGSLRGHRDVEPDGRDDVRLFDGERGARRRDDVDLRRVRAAGGVDRQVDRSSARRERHLLSYYVG